MMVIMKRLIMMMILILLTRGACSCESLLAPCDKESVSLKNEATLFTFIILILSKSSTTTTIDGLDQVRGYMEDIFSDRSCVIEGRPCQTNPSVMI